MPNWKKIALSGSSPEFSSINVDNSISAGSLTGSIDFNNLTNSPTLLSSSAQVVDSLLDQDVDFGTGHITAQRLTVSGSLSDWVRFNTDRVLIAKDLRHLDDSDTYLRFINDGVQLNAGGANTFEVSPSEVTVNPAGNDIDFTVESINNSNMLKVNADTDRVGIGINNPSHTLSVAGTVSASAYIGDGSGLTNVTSNITEEVTVSQTFTSATTASVNHLFGTKDVIVTVYDDNDDQFIPSRINTPDTNNVNIYMDPATTGRVVVAKGGHLVSGSIHKHLMTSVTSSTITHNLQEEFPVVQVYESASREMFIPETIKSIDENNTQVVLSELIDCYVVIKR